MGVQKLILFCSLILLIGTKVVQGNLHHKHQHRHTHGHGYKHEHCRHASRQLFVFGDSYADTGNNRKADSGSWNEPYGMTFPGKPAGRFSDGLVFTDLLARYMGLKSPVQYKWRHLGVSKSKFGMNFAFGGTGVFDTYAPYPNMTTQIDLFQQLLHKSVFTPCHLHNSVAHVSVAGNDYSSFLAKGGTMEGLLQFIPKVVNQLVLDVKSIYSLGVKKILVTALQPLGCLPRSTIESSFQRCNSTANVAVTIHNSLLQQAVTKLNNQRDSYHASPFIIIDFFNAFSSVLGVKDQDAPQGNFANPLKPCCLGINETYNCGSVDENGNKLYKICQDPKSHFFWDMVHPTQAGWTAVATSLRATLGKIDD